LNNQITYSNIIKAEAKRLGFFACGISKARFLEEEADRLESWLKKGMNATMDFMQDHFEKRLDPTRLVPGSRSVISVMINYYPDKKQTNFDAPILSKYTYGEDYHRVVKDKLYLLLNKIREKIGPIEGRVFVDSAPVMEKKWAELSGLAWRGKHSLMLTPRGSFFFIGELITDLELEYDIPIQSRCGNCRICIDACPTGAITEPYTLDPRKCIAYFTIEYEGRLPNELKGKFQNRLFGCDICQDVCPYNKHHPIHTEQRFDALTGVLNLTKEDWLAMKEHDFDKLFTHSALRRAGFKGLKRNLDFLVS
jgi:epoxyqueuosine reductase